MLLESLIKLDDRNVVDRKEAKISLTFEVTFDTGASSRLVLRLASQMIMLLLSFNSARSKPHRLKLVAVRNLNTHRQRW